MRTVVLITAGLMVLATGAVAQDKSNSQKFLTQAIEGNFAEVEMGKLAQKNGQSQQVKSFGQMLVTDHSNANQKAMEAAKEMAVMAPSGPNPQQKSDYEKMSKLTGANFDREFADHMVKDHKKDISEYESTARMQDPAGSYARATLPTLQRHLRTAEQIEEQTTGQR